MEVASMTYGILWGISLRKMQDFPLGPETGCSDSQSGGMCGSLEDTAMRWFKALNLLLIMWSHLMQMSESALVRDRIFPAFRCLALCIGSDCAQLTICWCGGQACCLFLPSSIRWFGLKEGTKETVCEGNCNISEWQNPFWGIKRG